MNDTAMMQKTAGVWVLVQPRRVLAWLSLAGPLAAALVMYLPALRSPFLTDDYILLGASRDMGFGAFLKSATVPWANPGTLELSQHYWRPLSFLTFRGLYGVFGANPLPYHLFQFGVHCAAVVLVYFLALRLTRNRWAAAVGATVMAIDPAGFESITWISALNSAALPAALGAWLAFARATNDPDRIVRRWMTISLVLEAVAFGYRETSIVIIFAMLLWYVGCERQGRLGQWQRTLASAAPPALLALAFAAWLLAAPGGGNSLAGVDRDTPHVFWFYVRQVLPVTAVASNSLLAWVQRGAGVALLALPIAAAVKRRWLIASLSVGLLAALIPYSVYNLGYGARYYYFPTALLGLLAAALIAEFAEELENAYAGDRHWLVGLGAAALGAVLVAGAIYGRGRVSTWTHQNPDVEEQWLTALRAEHSSLPPHGGLWSVDTPGLLTVFEGSSIGPALDYVYGGGPHPVYIISEDHIAFARSVMAPNDRLFEYKP
ncbi:MAG TPA: hypothetical protein VN697_01930 [Tepidiformaceae bacterium]|nr:hypothetical protein [Tepidiformaceae bacterium]